MLVDIENRESIDLSLTLEGIGHLSKKRKKVGESIVQCLKLWADFLADGIHTEQII